MGIFIFDNLGRVVLPKKLHDTFKIDVGDSLEIFVTNNQEIVFRKYEAVCHICGTVEEFIMVKGKQEYDIV
ncbi:hypothetical protein DNHGIG_22300 [Collibacillus ludicampi]|uniref:SpoVT-AbrB domain-containing protein n=1 Tax=Collibacillus ludicampi TaxID=2771369 RepID=A0AAV4LFS5_9BACL|nr:hypothetical protein DNHGIG_22300 [Collibacillus ludicampi]